MTVKLKPKQTIIALDVNSLEEIKSLISIIDKDLFRLKVGKQLFMMEILQKKFFVILKTMRGYLSKKIF